MYDRALVPFNLANTAVVGGAGPYSILIVRGQQMAPIIHLLQGVLLLSLPGNDVAYIPNAIQLYQLQMHRPSYVNAILIQSRGRAVVPVCDACSRARPGLCPFPQCIRAAGHFGGACGNCKWRDRAASCSVRDENQGGEQEDDSDDEPPASPPPAPPAPPVRTVPESHWLPAPPAPGSTPSNAIVLA